MTKLPRISGKRLVLALRKAGFEEIRIKGSHHFLRHADGRSTVVPVHQRETLGPGITAQILKDCEMTIDDVLKFL